MPTFDRRPDSAELTLADLIADAACVHLPAPRRPARRVIDLTGPAHILEIPAETTLLVENYSLGV